MNKLYPFKYLLLLACGLLLLKTYIPSGAETISQESRERLLSQLTGNSAGKETENPGVVVFVASWCSYCRALESDLHQAGVEFIRADIESDPRFSSAYQELAQQFGSGIPITLVGKQVFRGYVPKEILNAWRGLKKPSANSV